MEAYLVTRSSSLSRSVLSQPAPAQSSRPTHTAPSSARFPRLPRTRSPHARQRQRRGASSPSSPTATVSDTKVESGHALLAPAAQDAVSRWRFAPSSEPPDLRSTSTSQTATKPHHPQLTINSSDGTLMKLESKLGLAPALLIACHAPQRLHRNHAYPGGQPPPPAPPRSTSPSSPATRDLRSTSSTASTRSNPTCSSASTRASAAAFRHARQEYFATSR